VERKVKPAQVRKKKQFLLHQQLQASSSWGLAAKLKPKQQPALLDAEKSVTSLLEKDSAWKARV
jgi:hypothetical protein